MRDLRCPPLPLEGTAWNAENLFLKCAKQCDYSQVRPCETGSAGLTEVICTSPAQSAAALDLPASAHPPISTRDFRKQPHRLRGQAGALAPAIPPSSASRRSRLIHDLIADVHSAAAAIALYGFGSRNKDFHSQAVFDIRPQADKVVTDPTNYSVAPAPGDYADIARCHLLTLRTKAGYWVRSRAANTTFWPKPGLIGREYALVLVT